MASELTVKIIPITRMDCPTCIPVLEREVKRLDGVEEALGNYMAKTLKVTYDPQRVQLSEIEAAIERIGYRIAYKRYPSVVSRLRGLLKREKREKVRPLTDAHFPGKVLHASTTVAVLFSSPTCPICQVFKQDFGEIAEKVEGHAELYEMDISSTETWRRYEFLTIPTILVFRSGEVSGRFEALPNIKDIERALRA